MHLSVKNFGNKFRYHCLKTAKVSENRSTLVTSTNEPIEMEKFDNFNVFVLFYMSRNVQIKVLCLHSVRTLISKLDIWETTRVNTNCTISSSGLYT